MQDKNYLTKGRKSVQDHDLFALHKLCSRLPWLETWLEEVQFLRHEVGVLEDRVPEADDDEDCACPNCARLKGILKSLDADFS